MADQFRFNNNETEITPYTDKSLPEIWNRVSEINGAIQRDKVPDFLQVDLANLPKTEVPSLPNFRLIKITAIRFRKREDLKSGLEALYRVLHTAGAPFVYILFAKSSQVEICLGLYARDEHELQQIIPIYKTLQYSIAGFFPGCSFELVRDNEKINFIKTVLELPEKQVITGVPSVQSPKEQKDKAQNESATGFERLIDAMAGQEFGVMVVAMPLGNTEMGEFFEGISKLHDEVQVLKKATLQHSLSHQKSFSKSYTESDGLQESFTTGTQSTQSRTRQDGSIIYRGVNNLSAFIMGGEKAQTQLNDGTSQQTQRGKSSQVSKGTTESEADTTTRAVTIERTNKTADYISKQLDEMHQRAQNGKGIGMWRVGTTLLSRESATCDKVACIYSGMISGEKSHIDPIQAHKVKNSINPLSVANDAFLSGHPLGAAYSGLYTYLTSAELALMAGLPLYEVSSLLVEEFSDYGRSQLSRNQSQGIEIGKIVDRSVETSTPVYLTPAQLNRHCFVTGATGSGKSNTMRHLLCRGWEELKVPFLVIEPVKSEYRQLKNIIPSLQVYTLGHHRGQSLTLNPFDFETEVGLVSHIDHLKAAFNASLGMYSSMPFILEEILYKVYEQFGWDLGKGTNEFLERSAEQLGVSPDGPIRDLFLPRLSDLLPLVENVIKGFFPSMTDYGGSLLGALRARLTSLTKGTKGRFLNVRNSVPMEWLLKQPCILEIWPFADNEEKAFIMALILIKLYEFRESQHLAGYRPKGLEHLVVIEEAHRLLAKPQGQSEYGSNSRAKGVEVFADILAEIRSYGQGIIIVDQIPSKLIPDVIKNTDVKIVHRLVAKDDRELIGASMAIEDLQLRDLARQKPGLATVYFEGLHKSIQVQVPVLDLGTKDKEIEALDLSLLRRIESFGLSQTDVIADFPLKKQKIESYRLVHGILTNSLCTGIHDLRKLRANIIQRLNIQPSGSVWAFLTDGIHSLHDALLRYEIESGQCLLTPSQAGYLSAVAALFLRSFISGDEFEKELSILRAESLGVGLMNSSSGFPIDFLAILSGLYAVGTNGRFQREVNSALKADSKEEQLDWSSLQEILMINCNEMMMSAPCGPEAFCELGSRLLMQFRSSDKDVGATVGLAIGTLIRATDIAKQTGEIR
jgi:hypothetical protein